MEGVQLIWIFVRVDRAPCADVDYRGTRGQAAGILFQNLSAIDAIATFRLITEDVGDYRRELPVFWLCFKP